MVWSSGLQLWVQMNVLLCYIVIVSCLNCTKSVFNVSQTYVNVCTVSQ